MNADDPDSSFILLPWIFFQRRRSLMPKSSHLLTAQDALDLKSVHDAQISPDGALVAFTVGDVFKTDTKIPKSQVWVANADGSGARVFTSGPRSDSHPRWSPDGSFLAFLSDRIEDGKPQIYLIAREGGEARALTEEKGSLLSFQWSHDSKQIAFRIEDAETDEEKKRKEERDDANEFEQHPKFARVWILDLATRAARLITQGNVHAWEFDWSRDGRELVLVASDAPAEYEWYRTRLARVPARGGKPKTIFVPKGNKQLAMPRWSPDGKRIAFIACLWSDRGVIAGDLFVMNADGSGVRNLTEGARRDVSSYEWTNDGGAFVVVGFEAGDSAIGTLDAETGAYKRWWSGDAAFMDRFWQHFSISRDGATLAVAREDVKNPPDIWIAHVKNDALTWKQLSRVNPQTDEIQIGAMEKIGWKSSDGMDIQGYLVKPLGYRKGKRYPLIVWVHGGPASNYGPRYYALGQRAQLLAANGFIVLLPNPRGSYGWGTAFTESNVGDLGGRDWQDILAGVDYCIAQGFADPQRLGLAGWSYGGFMTAWGITQTNRFKAAMMGAAITNWLSFHGTSNLAVWDHIANNASPFERGGTYDKFSPMNFIARVNTPTLILHGEADPYVPVSQGYEVFRALKDLGIETEMVVYPREGHGILEKNHQLDLMRRLVEWFKRYLT